MRWAVLVPSAASGAAVQVLALLEEGEGNRHVGSTRMNEGSSRSHTVFRMVSPPAAWGVHACFSLCC